MTWLLRQELCHTNLVARSTIQTFENQQTLTSEQLEATTQAQGRLGRVFLYSWWVTSSVTEKGINPLQPQLFLEPVDEIVSFGVYFFVFSPRRRRFNRPRRLRPPLLDLLPLAIRQTPSHARRFPHLRRLSRTATRIRTRIGILIISVTEVGSVEMGEVYGLNPLQERGTPNQFRLFRFRFWLWLWLGLDMFVERKIMEGPESLQEWGSPKQFRRLFRLGLGFGMQMLCFWRCGLVFVEGEVEGRDSLQQWGYWKELGLSAVGLVMMGIEGAEWLGVVGLLVFGRGTEARSDGYGAYDEVDQDEEVRRS